MSDFMKVLEDSMLNPAVNEVMINLAHPETTVYILIGIPASGKTSWAHEQRKKNPRSIVLSSDYIREAIPEIKDDNAEVFRVMNKALKTHVEDKYFKHIYYDATNTSRRRRRALYRSIKSWDESLEVVAVFFSVPYFTALERNRQRERQVPDDVILRMHRQMQIPKIDVDCDGIIAEGIPIFKHRHDDIDEPVKVEHLFRHMNDEWIPEIALSDTPHDTPWHQESVFEHINMTIENSNTNEMRRIAVFHDLGKGVCKVWKGDRCTYRNHADVSAHYFFNYLMLTKLEDWGSLNDEDFNVLDVIYNHMHFHNGIGENNRRNNKISDDVMEMGKIFAETDNKSRIVSENAFFEIYGKNK